MFAAPLILLSIYAQAEQIYFLKPGATEAEANRILFSCGMKEDFSIDAPQRRGFVRCVERQGLKRVSEVEHNANETRIRSSQRLLNSMGYTAGPVDGIMGLKTRGAIRQFQRDRGLRVNGIPNRSLVNQLNRASRAGHSVARAPVEKPKPTAPKPAVVEPPKSVAKAEPETLTGVPGETQWDFNALSHNDFSAILLGQGLTESDVFSASSGSALQRTLVRRDAVLSKYRRLPIFKINFTASNRFTYNRNNQEFRFCLPNFLPVPAENAGEYTTNTPLSFRHYYDAGYALDKRCRNTYTIKNTTQSDVPSSGGLSFRASDFQAGKALFKALRSSKNGIDYEFQCNAIEGSGVGSRPFDVICNVVSIKLSAGSKLIHHTWYDGSLWRKKTAMP